VSVKSHVRIVINQEVVIDGDLGNWQATPPDFFKEALNPNAQPEPWMRCIINVIAEAAMIGQDVEIDVSGEPGEWVMKVKQW